jgi:hypothetical protein
MYLCACRSFTCSKRASSSSVTEIPDCKHHAAHTDSHTRHRCHTAPEDTRNPDDSHEHASKAKGRQRATTAARLHTGRAAVREQRKRVLARRRHQPLRRGSHARPAAHEHREQLPQIYVSDRDARGDPAPTQHCRANLAHDRQAAKHQKIMANATCTLPAAQAIMPSQGQHTTQSRLQRKRNASAAACAGGDSPAQRSTHHVCDAGADVSFRRPKLTHEWLQRACKSGVESAVPCTAASNIDCTCVTLAAT